MMIKSTKNTGSKGVALKSPCDRNNYNNQHKSRNDASKAKKSAGEGEKQNRICSSKPAVVQKTKSQSKINKTALIRDNRNNAIHKISSNLIYTRRFSRYTDVQRRLKTNQFKSTYENSGKFDENSTNYKSYVNTNKNKKNKTLLKYSICAEKRKTNKGTGLCQDFPGKGTYNHRFAYDQALKLHSQGVDADVLYKVKNSLDSVYVVNGTFARTNYKRPITVKYRDPPENRPICGQNPPIRKQPTIKPKNTIVEKHKPEEPKKRKEKEKDNEEALQLEEYKKKLELEEENRKRLLALEELKKKELERKKQLKREELLRKQKIREAELEQLSKMLNIQKSDGNKTKVKLETKSNDDDARRAREEQMERDRLKSIDEQNRKLMRQKMKQCLALKFQKNNVNITLDKLGMNPVEAYNKCQAITDCDKLKAAEKWALQCNDTNHDVSWLQTVACRIDSLGKRVDTSYKNKWMRNALDLAINDMAEKKQLSGCTSNLQLQCCPGKSPCNKNIKVCSSLLIKTRRPTHCQPCNRNKQTAACNMQKSRKFSVCPAMVTEEVTRCWQQQ